MPSDRYTKCVLTLIALCLLTLAARAWLPSPADAAIGDREPGTPESPPGPPTPPTVVARAWGRLAAVTEWNRIWWAFFEAPDGTIHALRLPRASETLTITRR